MNEMLVSKGAIIDWKFDPVTIRAFLGDEVVAEWVDVVPSVIAHTSHDYLGESDTKAGAVLVLRVSITVKLDIKTGVSHVDIIYEDVVMRQSIFGGYALMHPEETITIEQDIRIY